jgi:hypothetical protein
MAILFIQRTFDGNTGTIEDVGVDHGGFHMFVSQQLLDAADIITAFKKVGCK